MEMPPTVTAREMSLRRSPPQTGQGDSDMHSSSSLAHPVGLCLAIAAADVVQDALEGLLQRALAGAALVDKLELLAAGAVEDGVHGLLGQVGQRVRELKVVFLPQRVEVHPGDGVVLDVAPAAGLNAALQNGETGVGDDHGGVGLQLGAQTGTGGAGTVGIVEGKHAGRELREGDAAVLAGVVLAKGGLLVGGGDVQHHQSTGQGRGNLDGVGQTPGEVLLHNEAVDDDFNVMLLVLVQRDFLGQVVDAAVDARADVAAPAGVLQYLVVLALLAADDRGQQLKTRALGELHNLVDNLVDGLPPDFAPTLGAVGHADARPEQAQVIVNLGDGPDGGAGVLGGGLLVDGDGGAQTVNLVDVRLVHLPQELPRVGGQRLDIAPPALGIDGVESQTGFARARQARQDDQLVTREVDIDIFQVVFPRTADRNHIFHAKTCFSGMWRN